MSRTGRIRFSVGTGAAGRAIAAGCALPFVAVSVLLLWLTGRLLYGSLTERPLDLWGSLVPHLLVSVVFLFGVYVLGAGIYLMVVRFRYAGFLEGTRLVERIGFRDRAVDLATAKVSANYDPNRRCLQSLVARDQGSGAEAQLRVSREGRALPPVELVALADVLTRHRVRHGTDDPAFAIADELRDLAARSEAGADPAGVAVARAPARVSEPADPPPASAQTANAPPGQQRRSRSRVRGDLVALAVVVLIVGVPAVVIGLLVDRLWWALALAGGVGLLLFAEYWWQLRARWRRAG